MKYLGHYDRLIQRAQSRSLDGYKEKHHIVPRCMGGSNDPSNLVDLTAEEHFVAHQLLVKIYPNIKGLAFACLKMIGNPWGKRSNKAYGWLRKKHSVDTSKRMIGNTFASGRKQSVEEKQRRSIALKKHVKTSEHIAKVAAATKQFYIDNPNARANRKSNAEKISKPCTIDGESVFKSRNALVATHGTGKDGARHPNFRYV